LLTTAEVGIPVLAHEADPGWGIGEKGVEGIGWKFEESCPAIPEEETDMTVRGGPV
jgi:hypothetical protein